MSPHETHRQLRLSHSFASKRSRSRNGDESAGFDWGAFLKEGEEDFSASVDTSGFLDSSGSDWSDLDDLEAGPRDDDGDGAFRDTHGTTTTKKTTTIADPGHYEEERARCSTTENSTASSLTSPQAAYLDELGRSKKWMEKRLIPEYWRGRNR